MRPDTGAVADSGSVTTTTDGGHSVAGPLPSRRDCDARRAVLTFVERAAAEVPIEERVAVFDNDGTRDHEWLGKLLAEHYAGNDSNVRILAGGILAAYDGVSVEDFEARSDEFLRNVKHPTLGRGYLQCGYAPMIELLDHLAANGFATYIASGGGRDFMRPVSQDMYGIPRERVIGSTVAPAHHDDAAGGMIIHRAEADYLDDGPAKPVRIWSRVGRRPLLAAGNSNGDIPMLNFAQHADKPSLRLLVLHDDKDREFAYTAGAERALDEPTASAGRSSASETTGQPSSEGRAAADA
jgi:phosphoserine phosphatase